MFKVDEVLEQASGAIGVKRVFGEPYEKNGVTFIPAARVMGGAGGGEGEAPAPDGEVEAGDVRRAPTGSGAGFGMSGGPAGAYVIKGEDVRWVPAVDVNRLLLGVQLVLIVFFLSVRSIAKARARANQA